MNPKLAILSRVQGMAVARRRRLCAPASRIVIGAASPTPSCTGRPAIAPAAGGAHGVAISQRRFRIAQAPGPVKLEQRPRPIMTAIARRRRHARLAMAAPRGTSSRPLNGIRQTGDHPAGCAGTAMPSTPRWVREMAWPLPDEGHAFLRRPLPSPPSAARCRPGNPEPAPRTTPAGPAAGTDPRATPYIRPMRHRPQPASRPKPPAEPIRLRRLLLLEGRKTVKRSRDVVSSPHRSAIPCARTRRASGCHRRIQLPARAVARAARQMKNAAARDRSGRSAQRRRAT